MACKPEVLRQVPLFALLDDEETAVLAAQVELKTFAPRQRIYKIADPGEKAYVMVSGAVRVTTVDEDHQEVVVDEPAHGEFFGFASMLEQTPHQTNAVALEESVCVEVDRHDIAILLERKPMAGMDMLTVLGRQFHASQQLVRVRAARNPNEVIEEEETVGERVADHVASFGGSWTFITSFAIVLVNGTDPSITPAKVDLDVIGLGGGMEVLKSSVTDSAGKFRIDGLPTDQPIMIRASYKSANYNAMVNFDSTGKGQVEIRGVG